jgi:hypothetical protein
VHDLEGLSGIDCVLPKSDILSDIIGVNDLGPTPITDLVKGHAGKLHPLLVEVINISIGFGREDLLGHRFGHEAQAVGAFAQHFLGSLLFLDIGTRANPLPQGPVLIKQRCGACLEVTILSRSGVPDAAAGSIESARFAGVVPQLQYVRAVVQV